VDLQLSHVNGIEILSFRAEEMVILDSMSLALVADMVQINGIMVTEIMELPYPVSLLVCHVPPVTSVLPHSSVLHLSLGFKKFYIKHNDGPPTMTFCICVVNYTEVEKTQ
jgi:hypothetical protein